MAKNPCEGGYPAGLDPRDTTEIWRTGDHASLRRRLRQRYERVRTLGSEDPELALIEARRAAEAACKLLLLRRRAPIPRRATFESLRGELQRADLPATVDIALATIQRLGNFAAHDRDTAEYAEVGNTGRRRISESTMTLCLAALDDLYGWLFRSVLDEEPPERCVEPSGLWRLT